MTSDPLQEESKTPVNQLLINGVIYSSPMHALAVKAMTQIALVPMFFKMFKLKHLIGKVIV